MKKIHLLVATAFFALTLATATRPALVHAAATENVWLEPSTNTFYTNTTTIDDRFNVTVWVNSTTLLAAWQVYMEFNDTIINATRWFEPKTDTQYLFYGKITAAFPFPPDPGYVHLGVNRGRVNVGASLNPPPPDQPPSNGTAKLAILEFKVTDVPLPQNVSYTSALHINNVDTYLLDENGTRVNPIIQDGSYEFIYNGTYIPEFSVVFLFPVLAGLTLVAVAARKRLKLR